MSMEHVGELLSFPLQTAGLVLPFSEQVYLLICLSIINLCVAKAHCPKQSQPLSPGSQAFSQMPSSVGVFCNSNPKPPAKFISDSDSSPGLCFDAETSCPDLMSTRKKLGLRTEHSLGTQMGSRGGDWLCCHKKNSCNSSQ